MLTSHFSTLAWVWSCAYEPLDVMGAKTAGHTLSLQTLIVWCLLDEVKLKDMN